METFAIILQNLVHVGVGAFALIGVLVIAKHVSTVHRAEREKRALLAVSPAPRSYTPSTRDYEAELCEMRVRAETAEHSASAANERADEIRAQLDAVIESAAAEEEYAKEEATWRKAREEEFRRDELTSALQATFDEAEYHWQAGLSKDERAVAWSEHWKTFGPDVAKAMEVHTKWSSSLRR